MTAAVVGVLGLAAVVGVLAANSGGDDGDGAAGPVVAPSGAVGDDRLIIPVGASDAPSTLTVWEDFRCPACAFFETTYRDTIHELTDSGQIKVEYRLATIIDGNMGGSGSLNAANAAACAQDAGRFVPYHDVLFQNQPMETDDAFSNNQTLFDLAGKVQGLDTPCLPQLRRRRHPQGLGERVQRGVPRRGLPGHSHGAAERRTDLPSRQGRRADLAGEPEEVGHGGQPGQAARHGHPRPAPPPRRGPRRRPPAG